MILIQFNQKKRREGNPHTAYVQWMNVVLLRGREIRYTHNGVDLLLKWKTHKRRKMRGGWKRSNKWCARQNYFCMEICSLTIYTLEMVWNQTLLELYVWFEHDKSGWAIFSLKMPLNYAKFFIAALKFLLPHPIR